MAKGYKLQIVFSGKVPSTYEETISFARACLKRASRGDIAAMHDIWYIVNMMEVSPEEFGATAEELQRSSYYCPLQAMV